MAENVRSDGETDKGDHGTAHVSAPPISIAAEMTADDETLAKRAVVAITILAGRAGTPAAEDAAAVAIRAVMALAVPDDVSHTRAVERMRRALFGADGRADRAEIYAVADAVEAAALLRRQRGPNWGDTSDEAPSWLRAQLAARWPDLVQRLTEGELAGWLDDLVVGRFRPSGVVARILVAFRWFEASKTISEVTKLVSEALRARRALALGEEERRAKGEHRAKRRRST